ncbi:PH domain-containing protein [Streptomyces humi]|uniref:PH domain-containing protein n=1 Tax=Streptomyces humi TaxID=1428620 RepID=UPI00062888D7|nr:PH domain-containing protein [Streptomyces humi]
MTTPLVKDRTYRSPMALVGGVLLLAIIGWLGIDALIRGHGRTPWLALAMMILLVPLVAAFTLRPAVFAGEDRLRIRNPFRVITLPWAEIAALRSGFSNEVVASSGAKYQLWAIPVSLRGRKRAARRTAKSEADAQRGRTAAAGPRSVGVGAGFRTVRDTDGAGGPVRAEADQIMDELRQLLESRSAAESARGEVTVRWAYEVAAPAVAGAVLLAILLAVG